jgi:hypothetical protein
LVNKYIDTNLLILKVAEDTEPVRAVDMVVEAKEAEAEDMVEAAVSLSNNHLFNAVIFQTFKRKFSTQAVREAMVAVEVDIAEEEVMIL